MTDQPNAPEAGQKPDQAPKPEFQPITSQEQLNALLGDRLARERAKFADYDELKAKATKFDEAEAKNKSELEKATEANTKLQAQLQQLQLENLRHEVVAAKGLDPAAAKHLIGANREELEQSADELAQLIGAKQRRTPEPIPHSGAGDPRQQVGGFDAGVQRARAKYHKN